MKPNEQIRIVDLGALGLRIACRKGTIDERAAKGSLEWAKQATPIPVDAQGEAILDVGAHIGGFTLLAARLAPEKRVLAIEPCRASYEMLVRNVELNDLHNVETAHLALSDRTGTLRLYHDPGGNWGHTATKSLSAGHEDVESQTLEGFLREKQVNECAFAKFNCEGSEFPILMNTPNATLRKIEEMIVQYHTDLIEPPFNLAGLKDRLRKAGFDLECRGSSAHGRVSARRRWSSPNAEQLFQRALDFRPESGEPNPVADLDRGQLHELFTPSQLHELWWRHRYEAGLLEQSTRRLLAEILRPGDLFVDIGAWTDP